MCVCEEFHGDVETSRGPLRSETRGKACDVSQAGAEGAMAQEPPFMVKGIGALT